jgi:peroxiredoxin
MRRPGIVSLKFAGLVLAAAALLGAKKPVIGQPAPDFRLVLIDGSKVPLHDLRGQVVVLNFWATWCVPCKKELPLLDAYYRLQQSHGLRVFAVTTEDSVPNSQLKPLFKAMAIQPVRRLDGPYEILDGVPTNYVIDRTGVVRFAKAGAFDLEELNELLVPLLKEPVPAEAATAS